MFVSSRIDGRPLVLPVMLSLLAVVALSLGLPAAARAQAASVDEIVAKNLDARGGADKLRAVTSVRMTYKMKGRGVDVPVTSWAQRPNKMRRETINDGQTFVVAFDGTTVWGINPNMGPMAREIKGPPADMTKQDADDFDTVLLDYKQKGHTVELVDANPVAGVATYHLRVTKKNGRVQDVYLNADTMLESKITMDVEQAGRKGVVATEFANYKAVDGIMVPFSIRQTFDGKPVAEVVYERVQFNLPLDESLFRMPTAKPAH